MANEGKQKKPAVNYIDNKKFYNCIVDYKARVKEAIINNKPKPQIPDFAGKCIQLIADNMITMQRSDKQGPAFLNYSFTEEMISYAVINCIMYFDNFDPEKTNNPFAYFSRIVYFAFLRQISKEKKQLYIKYKTAINHGIFDAVTSIEAGCENTSFEVFDNLVDYVEKYEKNAEIKKNKISVGKKPKKKKNLELLTDD